MAKKNTLNNIEKALQPMDVPMGEVDVELEEEILPEDEEITVELDEDGGATISIGEEEGKGNSQVKEAYVLWSRSTTRTWLPSSMKPSS